MTDAWSAYPVAQPADPWAAYPQDRRGTLPVAPAAAPAVSAKPQAVGGPGGAAKAPQGSAHISNLAPLATSTDSVSAADPRAPLTKAMRAQSGPLQIIDDPTKLPKFETTAIASLPKDPNAKAFYLASRLFPGMAPGQALQRIGNDGQRLYYVADDGKAYYAEPSFSTAAPARTVAELPDLAASGVGPSLSTIGGMVGGIIGGPDPASVVTAAGGGMLGDAIRQAGAKYLAHAPGYSGTVDDFLASLKQNAVEGASQGVNQAVGLGVGGVVGKAVNRNPLNVSAYDINALTAPRLAEVKANADLAKRMGVSVTPGEAGNIGSLLAGQRQIARQPEANTFMNDFYQNRNIFELPGAFSKTLDKISPQASSEIANRDLGAAAATTVKAGRQARSAAARPVYDQAFAANRNVKTANLDSILQTPAGRQALRGVVTDLQNDRNLLATLPNGQAQLKAMRTIASANDPAVVAKQAGLPLQAYDLLKQKLWDLEKAAEGEGGKPTFSSRSIGNLRSELTGELDGADATATRDAAGNITAPGAYSNARGIFESNSPAVTDLEKGVVGIAAKPKANALQNLPKVLFSASSSDPYSIAQAKSAFFRAGQMDQWNAGVRSFLQNTFDDAAKQDQGPAASIWRTIAGDKKQMANLRAALGTPQFDALNDFMKVAEMVKRAPKEGSPTATDLGGRASFAGSIAKGAAAVSRGTLSPWQIGPMVADKIIDASAGKNAMGLAKAITDPDAVASLKRLRTLPPGGKKFIQELTYLGSVLATDKGVSALSPQQPMQPGTIPGAAP